jgi:hypothetical protein
MEIKKIETYSLYEFCQAVQESVLEGWRFDFESNENFPVAFGSMLVTGMVKAESKIEGPTELITEETPAVNTEVKRTRKSKE